MKLFMMMTMIPRSSASTLNFALFIVLLSSALMLTPDALRIENAAVEDETLLTTSTAPLMAMDGHEELMESPAAQALTGHHNRILDSSSSMDRQL
jgi:hypothetical protein